MICALVCLLIYTTSAWSQVLLDRVVARVGDQAITLSDARAAAGIGLVERAPGEEAIAAATRGLIDRQLMLTEVARFSPPEPDPQAVNREVAALEARAGSRAQLDALMRSTGLNGGRIRELARDNLRIQAYLTQRFGATQDAATIERWIADLRRRADVQLAGPTQ